MLYELVLVDSNFDKFILLFASGSVRTENMARKAAGEEPLPEEDPSNPIFKPLPEPSRLDSYLITNQVANYCNQINGYIVCKLCKYETLIQADSKYT